MAHEIEVLDNGEAAFFSAKELPWHRLGKVLDNVVTAEEALSLAKLDWEVILKPVFFQNADGTFEQVPDRFSATRDRDNRSLGIVSSEYNPFQNIDAFSFFDTITGSGDAKYETAGSLRGGQRVFLSAKIGDTLTVGDSEDLDTYLLISTSHDGTQAFTAAVTMIRPVCANTVSAALREAKRKWSIRHNSTLDGKIQEAREALNLTFRYQDAFSAKVEEMLNIEMEKDEFIRIMSDVLPDQKRKKEKNLEDLVSVFENEKTVIDSEAAGTVYGAYNALTFWSDHVLESRSDAARFTSIAEGKVEEYRNQFYRRAMAGV